MTDRRWTVLLAENGCGKSTVLRGIAMLTAGSEALVELLGNADTWIRDGTDEATLEGEVQTKEGEIREIAIRLRRGMKFRDMMNLNADGLESLDAALEHSQRNYFVVGYGASRRLGSASVASHGGLFRSDRANTVQTLFHRDAVLNPLESWAVDLHYRKQDDGLVMVRETLNQLLPELELVEIDRERKALIFKTQDGNIPLDQLSDGYQNLAAWLGDFLFNITHIFKDYKNPFEVRGLLLLDELGLHLHPILQRNLVQMLRDKLPQLQIVATSHSPLIAGCLQHEELSLLKRTRAGIIVERPEANPYGLSADQILASSMFGLKSLRVPEFEEELSEKRRLAGEGDVSAAIELTRMLALGGDWEEPSVRKKTRKVAPKKRPKK